jgi:hypothetical protein
MCHGEGVFQVRQTLRCREYFGPSHDRWVAEQIGDGSNQGKGVSDSKRQWVMADEEQERQRHQVAACQVIDSGFNG